MSSNYFASSRNKMRAYAGDVFINFCLCGNIKICASVFHFNIIIICIYDKATFYIM
jgi:hypothetical protein